MTLGKILLAASVLFMVTAGQLLLKKGASLLITGGAWQETLRSAFNWPLLTGLFAYGLSAVLWVWLLKDMDISRGYIIFSLSFVIVPVVGALLYGEPLSPAYFIGLALIVAGITVVFKWG